MAAEPGLLVLGMGSSLERAGADLLLDIILKSGI
jgi:hypothetical protein